MDASSHCGAGIHFCEAEEQQVVQLAGVLPRLDAGPIPDALLRFRDDPLMTERLIVSVTNEISRRKRRIELLGVSQDVFSMPAWELLLELFLADLSGKRNYVSTVGLDTTIPQSTVQRWLVILEQLQLVQRQRDRLDRRRHWVSLTRKAQRALRQYFAD